MNILPTLRQLQFFTALTRRGSFSKAAEDCLVSQSTLSSAIKELEGLLGAQLVDRSTRAFALTPVGEDVANRSLALLSLAEDLVRAAAERRPLEGPFHLGVIPTIAPFLLPAVAPRLQAKFPKLSLYLREDLTAALAERLASGQLDAALLAFPYEVPGANVIDLGADPFWFVSRADHALAHGDSVAVDDLENASLILLEDGHCLRDHAVEACKLKPSTLSAAFGATSLFTLTQMAQAGLGATLLPELAVKAGLAASAGLVARPLSPADAARRIGLAWRKGSGRREEAELIAAVIRDCLESR